MIKSLLEYSLSQMTKNVAETSSLWIESDKDGKSDFQAMSDYILLSYNMYLEEEHEAVTNAICEIKKRKQEIEEKISKLNEVYSTDARPFIPQDLSIARDILNNDVLANKTILEKLIQEQQEHIKYIQHLLEDRKQISDIENPLVKELGTTIDKLFVTGIKVVSETLRRYEAQLGAIIKPDNMNAEELVMRIEGKKGLLVKDLSETEKQIAEYESMLQRIEKKKSETTVATELIQKKLVAS